ncbi:MAG: isoprenyl transferase [Desulfobacterales bacterium CG07_land_8_20_14_0_80_52_14]|nr:MAG: isoprenyl transferase [Desulfobacterales bacterium CG23_combo_of_CG06-09_8_20_14_all_52_9]PIU49888.1 MAG: isoprenyl transferase [Desulfobacterales bacterium CG07_land_8_20_14_0_80_52_14]
MNSDPAVPDAPRLDGLLLPRHVAMIMDGNGRWARKRMLNRIRGHEKGADAVRTVVRTSRELGIPYLTLYAFSTENWERPETEIAALMMLLKRFLKSEQQEMLENGIRLNAVGQIDHLPADVRSTLEKVMMITQHNMGMLLNLALSYGGRAEIIRAVRDIVSKVQKNELDPEQITDDLIGDHLYTRGMPDPDLLIRTGGEMRVSNFLLWQIAYTEIFVTSTLWPDFSKEEYIGILRDFQKRERRFGKTGA